MLGAVEYLEWIGTQFGEAYAERYSGQYSGRRLKLKQAMSAIRAYEFELSRERLETLEEMPGVQIYGLRGARRLEARVPIFSFTLKGWNPHQAAERLGREGIYVWDGNYYAISVTERLGLEQNGGMVRVGPVHYNTLDEIGRLRQVLAGMAAG